MQSTITLTFGDQAENHVGMQKIGQPALNGFTHTDLLTAKANFENIGCICELINLSDSAPKTQTVEPAYVLIVRGAINKLLKDGADGLLQEQNVLVPDKKAFMYGRVVNKHARHNLCFDTTAQAPDYEKGKGRIIAYSQVPKLSELRDSFPAYIGDKAKDLTIEGNYYYDIAKCGIGYHGDSERMRVIGVRLGATIPLHYQWFLKNNPIGERIKLSLNHGNCYIMSEKATGNDWKIKNKATLRHAAGCQKFLDL
jgi:hypothetical protein